jgi:F-type H+-transporting ATPase subunit b
MIASHSQVSAAMRVAASTLLLLVLTASPASAAAAGGEGGGLMSPSGGLMFWTLVIFGALFFILKSFAFPPILAAVEARERTLQEAIDNAKRDREEAARLLAEHRAQIEGARAEAQKLIADGRATGEQLRVRMMEETKAQQQDMLDRARREIETEKTRAIAEMRREAVDLAIAGASKVIERNLDDQQNRRLVESFLGSIKPIQS